MTRSAGRLRGLGGLCAFVFATVAIFKLIFVLMDLRAGKGSHEVTIGSKADTEGILLAEIIARRIERATGLTVTRRTALGGTQLCFQALLSGEIDLYPEYTGTALVALLERPAMTDRRKTFELVQLELLRKRELVLLEPFAFNNTYALAIARSKARALGVRTITDLARHPQLSAGFTAEFMARQDGWPGLRERYRLAFRSAPRTLEAGLMYRAAQQSEVDV